MIELRNFTAGYDRGEGKQTLNGVDLVMEREKVIIVGPNGSGKTTLFRSIIGLVRQNGGEATGIES